VLAGLRERDRTGRGMRVTASLYDVALSLSGYHLLGWLGDGTDPGPLGNELGLIAPYGTFPTSDGELMIAAGNDALFRKLCAVLGLEDLPAQADYATNPARVRHREALNALVGERTRRFPTEALLERLRAGGVPAAPIRTIAEAARDPQTAASGMLAAAEDDPDYPAMPLPIRWNGARSRVGRRPPRHPGTRS
jgi:crotonobetainyl-CoA:carnitine CoA-transferase CaiB-like acyl-CoA transferase